MSTMASTLQLSLEKHNATFETLLNLIPAKYYLVQELSEEQVRNFLLYMSCVVLSIHEKMASKFQKNSKKLKAPKQAIKEASKKAKREKV